MSQAGQTRRDSLDRVLARVDEISTLPQIAIQVMTVVNDPDSSASDLKSVVERDPSLSARVLRHVNSARYALRTEVRNIHQAISYLGFTQIRNLAVTASVADTFKKGEAIGSYTREGLWKHLVSVAVTARLVAARCGLPNFEDAFLSGLLHDLGIILLDQFCHEPFREVLTRLTPQTRLVEVEYEVLGFDHTMLGEAVATKWKFPRSVAAATRYHHRAESSLEEDRPIIRTVELANFLCHAKKRMSVGGGLLDKPSPETFAGLKIGRDDFRVLWEDLEGELTSAQGLLNI